jgi:dipeptidyl aminopeptidase/acylaminoacyl peptidase
MRSIIFSLLLVFTFQLGLSQSFTLQQVKSYPFPNELTVSGATGRIAWAVDAQGIRNIYVAEAPVFVPRKLTIYEVDHAQELSYLALSNDGKWVVYIKGGDFGSNWDDELPVNPTFLTVPPKVQIWSIPFDGGKAVALGEGINPAISPDSKSVAFSKGGQIYQVPIDGKEEAKKLFNARGKNTSPVWSPDGTKLAFESNRNDHAYIGVYQDSITPIHWVAPGFDYDEMPRWSADGKKIAFVRTEGRSFAADSILAPNLTPWSIHTYNLTTKSAAKLWSSKATKRGSYPYSQGGPNLHWANDRIVFLSYEDGWPHLYSMSELGGSATLLTPGNYMVEYVSLSPDKKTLYFCANMGLDALDIDRRHIVSTDVTKQGIKVLTPGMGNEWTPFVTGDNSTITYISATAQRPPAVTVMDLKTQKLKLINIEIVPKDFPDKNLVTPKQVIFKAPDGTDIHATWFEPVGKDAKKPAVVYIHGGPMRQMLLGWHYSNYYSNAYALNQYLASMGIGVLSVNYRMGIGYGHDFHFPDDGGTKGAGEYQDIKAAGEWLAKQPFVDATKIGVYGGSYGGYLTAMALGRNSDIFAAGVDIHGVHERTNGRVGNWLNPNQYEKAPDAEKAVLVAWQSSPVADVATWKSPVLIIHADDDRNVNFNQSTDLVQRLRKKGVEHETMVIVDDTHHFMLFANQLQVNQAVADYFKKKFLDK